MTSRASLLDALTQLAARAEQRPLALGEVADTLGGSAFSLLAAVLCLPFVSPVPTGPYATVGGVTLALLAVQLLRGRPAPALPQRVRVLTFSARVWAGLLAGCTRLVNACQRISRPRLHAWVEGPRGVRLRGAIMLTGGLLITVPVVGLPFNNALPALAVLLACLAELEDDGGLALIAAGVLVIAAVYIIGVAVAVVVAGSHVLTYFD